MDIPRKPPMLSYPKAVHGIEIATSDAYL